MPKAPLRLFYFNAVNYMTACSTVLLEPSKRQVVTLLCKKANLPNPCNLGWSWTTYPLTHLGQFVLSCSPRTDSSPLKEIIL